MIKADVPQLARELNALAEVYAKPILSERAMEVWFSTLKDLPYERVAGALIAWPKVRGKMPAPNELLQMVSERMLEEREQQDRVERARIMKETEAMSVSGSAQARAIIAKTKECLRKPRRTPREHWQHVYATFHKDSIGYRYADEVLHRKKLSMQERVPGEDDEVLDI